MFGECECSRWAGPLEDFLATGHHPRCKAPRVLTLTKFICSVCGQEYLDRDEALACVKKGWKVLFAPGDIVVELCALGLYQTGDPLEDGPASRYGWHDGDPLWIFKAFPPREGRGPAIETFAPYFVVGAVTSGEASDLHEPVYHCFSEAFRDGKVGFRQGWTSRSHYAMGKIDNPPAVVVAAAQKYIGMKSRRLL